MPSTSEVSLGTLYLHFPLTELKHGTLSEQSALSLLVINIIPCTLLLLENWVELKLFTWLLHLGLDYAKLGDLPGYDISSEGCNTNSEGGRLKQFIARVVEDAINNKIIDLPDRPISCKCLFNPEQGTIGLVTMDNMHVKTQSPSKLPCLDWALWTQGRPASSAIIDFDAGKHKMTVLHHDGGGVARCWNHNEASLGSSKEANCLE
jgi:hypothetical protein